MSADVREKHGTIMTDKALIVNEREDCITVIASSGQINTTSVYLTPNEARYIAAKLRRVARRVEARIMAR